MAVDRISLGIIAALSLAAPTAMRAQDTGRVSGVVRSPQGDAVDAVEILVQGTALRFQSTPDGRFTLTGLPVGRLVLVFRRIGYRPEALAVDVTADPRALGPVMLEPGAFKLPEISVSARYAKPSRYANTTKYDDFYRRRKIGGGIYLDRDLVDQRFVGNTFQMFLGLSGVHVDLQPPGVGSKLWFSRCNESPPAIGVWVDGVRQLPPWGIGSGYGLAPDRGRKGVLPNAASAVSDQGGADRASDLRSRFVEEVINSVSPADIEAIEVYKGPSGLPGEFNQGDNCGAIVIWTREGGVLRGAAPQQGTR